MINSIEAYSEWRKKSQLACHSILDIIKHPIEAFKRASDPTPVNAKVAKTNAYDALSILEGIFGKDIPPAYAIAYGKACAGIVYLGHTEHYVTPKDKFKSADVTKTSEVRVLSESMVANIRRLDPKVGFVCVTCIGPSYDPYFRTMYYKDDVSVTPKQDMWMAEQLLWDDYKAKNPEADSKNTFIFWIPLLWEK